jgi:hypothetical protein
MIKIVTIIAEQITLQPGACSLKLLYLLPPPEAFPPLRATRVRVVLLAEANPLLELVPERDLEEEFERELPELFEEAELLPLFDEALEAVLLPREEDFGEADLPDFAEEERVDVRFDAVLDDADLPDDLEADFLVEAPPRPDDLDAVRLREPDAPEADRLLAPEPERPLLEDAPFEEAEDFFAAVRPEREDDLLPPREPEEREPFFSGTFSPFSRASESPIAIACLREVTFLPLPPLLNLPSFISCITSSTFFPAPFEYLAI